MIEDTELEKKVMSIYFRKSYTMYGEVLQEELDFINNNEIKVYVDSKTARNGYDSDKEKIKMLTLNHPYIIKTMDVGRSSSTIELKEYPRIIFNSVNFNFTSYDK